MAIVNVKLRRANHGIDRQRSCCFVVINTLLMVHKVVAVRSCNWVITQTRIKPRRASKATVIPNIFCVVIDHILVNCCAICRAVVPPYLIKSFVGSGKNLKVLTLVDIAEDVITQVAAQCLHATIVNIKLVNAHPINFSRCNDGSVLAINGNFVSKKLDTPHNWGALVLKRIHRRICEHNNFLTSLYCGNDC